MGKRRLTNTQILILGIVVSGIIAIAGMAIDSYLKYPEYLNEKAVLEARIAQEKTEATRTIDQIQEKTQERTEPIISTQYPPVATIEGPFVYEKDNPVIFSGKKSYDPNGDEIISYFWTVDDGRATSNYDGSTITHSFRNAGPHVIVLKVQDNTGLYSFSRYTIDIIP